MSSQQYTATSVTNTGCDALFFFLKCNYVEFIWNTQMALVILSNSVICRHGIARDSSLAPACKGFNCPQLLLLLTVLFSYFLPLAILIEVEIAHTHCCQMRWKISEASLCDPNKANPPPEEENLPLQDGNHSKWGKGYRSSGYSKKQTRGCMLWRLSLLLLKKHLFNFLHALVYCLHL